MDEARLWALIEDQGEREPLIACGEARAAVDLLQHLAQQYGEQGQVAAELAGRLARRLPADEQAHDGAECTRWTHLRPTAPKQPRPDWPLTIDIWRPEYGSTRQTAGTEPPAAAALAAGPGRAASGRVQARRWDAPQVTDFQELRARAAADLDFDEPWMGHAWAAVPRHQFVPDTVWVVQDGVYQPFRRSDDPDRWARLVYDSTTAIATQVDDGDPAAGGGDVPTSSISAPVAVFAMLAELDLQPEHRVLEIGAGTGYNAALLAERVGARRVTTLEIDPEVADGARAALHRAGYGGVTVLEADGEQGWPRGAPYDRLVATASVTSIPWAWVEQVQPGGLIVSPFRTVFCSHGLARLTVSGGHAEGRFAGAVNFMAVRGQRARPHISEVFSAESWKESRESKADLDVAMLADPHAEFAVGLRLADVAHWPQDGGHWWCSRDSWAYSADGAVYQWGPRNLADETADALAWWADAGRPELFDFGLTVTADGHRVWLGDPSEAWPLAAA
ncbi:methyltransferase domain-containing protein [Streptomyces sparsogenes]|uniref:methyltransferase domain-containing protein n=1 Tax=Streptomyces sparsogenes TaxID=67365 RepID=UPI0033FC8C56